MVMELFSAIENDDLEAVKNFLANTPDVAKVLVQAHKCEPYGPAAECSITPLKYAVYCSTPDILKVLIDAGAKPNQVFDEGLSALALAAHIDRPDMAEELLKNGANPNMGSCGAQPLMYAQSGEMTELLIKNGARLGAVASIALSSAAYNGLTDKLNVLLKNKVNPNRPKSVPAMLSAVQNKSLPIESFEALLNHGANPNFCSYGPDGARPLLQHCLFALCEPDLTDEEADLLWKKTDALIQRGAHVNSFNELGETPLVVASFIDERFAHIQEDLVQKMIDKGADVRFVCQGGTVWDHYRLTASAKVIRKKLNELNNTPWKRFWRAVTGRQAHEYC